MKKIEWIKKKPNKRIFPVIFLLLSITCSFFSSLKVPDSDKTEKTKVNRHFNSAFDTNVVNTGKDTLLNDSRPRIHEVHYTIQLCTFMTPVNDVFLTGSGKIRPIRVGDVYQYIFSEFRTIEEARKELKKVQIFFPGSYIREFDYNKLGKAIDLNIDYFEFKDYDERRKHPAQGNRTRRP